VAIVSIQLGAAICQNRVLARRPAKACPPCASHSLRSLMLVICRLRMRLKPAARTKHRALRAALGGMKPAVYMARAGALGIAGCFGISGPLTLAMLSSRRPIDLHGLRLAGWALGLLPLQAPRDIDPTGRSTRWARHVRALYIFFGQKAGAGEGVAPWRFGDVRGHTRSAASQAATTCSTRAFCPKKM